MAEVTLRRRGEMVRRVFEILWSHPEGLQAKHILDEAERTMKLSDFEKSTYPKHPNVRRVEKLVRFSTIPVVKAGWLVKSKGQWMLTEEGRRAFQKFTDPEEFTREAVRLFRRWRADQPETEEEEEEEESPGAATTLEEAEESAWTEIQRYLGAMNPYDLQELVAALLRAMAYHVSWVAP